MDTIRTPAFSNPAEGIAIQKQSIPGVENQAGCPPKRGGSLDGINYPQAWGIDD